jgi:hypothetical protein
MLAPGGAQQALIRNLLQYLYEYKLFVLRKKWRVRSVGAQQRNNFSVVKLETDMCCQEYL